MESGGDENYDFVLAVLRNYDGESFINKICKEIIKLLPADSLLRTEVAVAMLSTGVVVGEFGMAEAYERKTDEVTDWLNDPDEKVRDFARSYMAQLEAMTSVERKRAEEEITLRKHRYGEK
jgi:hypothetical protein